MPKAYKVTRHTIKFDKNDIHDVFSVKPVNYGTLTTFEAATQIAKESSLTEGDVLNVLNRYASYVVTGLRNGYAIELLGFGKLDLRFIKAATVSEEKKATAALIKGMMPNFTPSFTLSGANKTRVYDLIPQRIQLVKYDASAIPEESTPDNPDDSGSTGGGGNTGEGTGGDDFSE